MLAGKSEIEFYHPASVLLKTVKWEETEKKAQPKTDSKRVKAPVGMVFGTRTGGRHFGIPPTICALFFTGTRLL